MCVEFGQHDHISQVYIPKRRTLTQVLPPANEHIKLFATKNIARD